MKKIIALTVAGILALAVYFTLTSQTADRVQYLTSLFSGAEQYENFNRAQAIFPTTTLNASTAPFDFSNGDKITLPQAFNYQAKSVQINQFLKNTDTSALLVLQNGAIRYEQYWLTGGRDVNWISMSVAKSFISALIGIAIDEGFINSIEEPITQYCPSLAGSAYDGVRIKDILQMSSGANWNEDYSDPNSDINRLGRIMAIGGSLNEFAASLTQAREPGTYNLYNSTDTQVLGMLLTNATGRTITDYMQEKLWQPLGMESDAYWMIDDENMEMAFAGLNATARDYAKLGELYRLDGTWQGNQLVPKQWVHNSVTPDAPHLMPGENKDSDFPLGYGYQWWIPEGTEGEYSAIGVYNQFIYVNPSKNLVIVKLSANSEYGTSKDESSYREIETFEFFRAIGDSI